MAAGALAYFLEERHTLFLNGAATTEGTVVGLVDLRSERDGAPVHHAIVEFRDREGRTHRFRSRSGGSGTNWRIGERYTVLYRPERPQRAELKHEMPGFIGGFGVLAVVLFAAGAFVWFFRRPRAAAGTASYTDSARSGPSSRR